MFVTHTSPDEDAEYLKEEIIKLAAPEEVLITRAGSVVSSHCGPAPSGFCIWSSDMLWIVEAGPVPASFLVKCWLSACPSEVWGVEANIFALIQQCARVFQPALRIIK